MRTIVFFSLLILSAPNLFSQTDVDELPYLFNFTIEIELSNDQGNMNTGEYLKDYGTKGKTRALNDLYPMMDSCFIKAMERKSFFIHPMKELSDIKSNVYGYPVMSLRKVVKSGKGKQYLSISLKDIGFVNPEMAT